jgi:cytochrome o ubiquinol oxidase subunit 3
VNTIAKNRKLEQYDKAEFGFWLYLMTDVILFASLFATYMILRGNIAEGSSASQLLDPTYALAETILLLTSSFTVGIAVLSLRYKRIRLAMALLLATLICGVGFLALELSEFSHLVAEGQSWRESAFLSSFFTLVGTHGLHITIGLIWGIAMAYYIKMHGSTSNSVRKFTLFSLFWHFLDLVWIFIFTIVYLGAAL